MQSMTTQLETPRLILRPLHETDAAAIFDLESRPEVLQYLATPPQSDIGQAQALILFVQKQYAAHGIGRFAVEWKATGECIGWAGLKFCTEPLNGLTGYHDLGYRLLPRFWGMGIATEAVRASLDWGFRELGLPKIYAGVMPGNLASCAVVRKFGFRFLHEFELADHVWHWFLLDAADRRG